NQQAQAIEPPSIREQMTFIRNFGRGVLAPDLLTSGADKVGEYMGSTAQQIQKLEARVQKARAAAQDRPPGAAYPFPGNTNVLDIVDQKPDPPGNVILAGPGADVDATAEARNPLAITHQKNARIDITDVDDILDPTRIEREPE